MSKKTNDSIRVGDSGLITAIIEIQDLLDIDFGWIITMDRMALQEKSLQTIIKAIKKLKTNPQQGETNAR